MNDDAQSSPLFSVKTTSGSLAQFTERRIVIEQVTLRDQFAMAALPAVVHWKAITTVTKAADAAYQVADAMLKAREAKQ